jgi:hypothetical protein
MADREYNLEQEATLTLGGEKPRPVNSEGDLQDALKGLSRLDSGQEVKLVRGPQCYMKATRCGDLWSVTTRNGGYLTLTSFTAAMTTDYSKREVENSRAAGSIWKRIRRSISTPSPERSLSETQVQTLFGEFFLGARFSIPQSGA